MQLRIAVKQNEKGWMRKSLSREQVGDWRTIRCDVENASFFFLANDNAEMNKIAWRSGTERCITLVDKIFRAVMKVFVFDAFPLSRRRKKNISLNRIFQANLQGLVI